MVDEIAASVRYQHFLECLEDVQRQLQSILDESGSAITDIGTGQDHARSAEREAERQEIERREREALQTQ